MEKSDFGSLAKGIKDMRPSQEQLDKWKKEDIDRKQAEIDSIKGNGYIDRLNRKILEIELAHIKSGKTLEEREYFMDDLYNQKVYTDKLTQYGNLKRTRRIVKESNLDMFLNEREFDNFEVKEEFQKEMFDKSRSYAENPEGSLVISGQSGAGKTHILTAVSGFLMMYGHEVQYKIWKEEIERIKSLEFDQRAREIQKLIDVDILYLDDFLKAEVNNQPLASDVEYAIRIINGRYYRKKKTIISMEWTYDELAQIDTSVAGRLREMCRTDYGSRYINVAYKEGRNYRDKF